MWLRPADVERLSNRTDADVEQAARRLVGTALGEPPSRTPEIACPECKATLRRVRVPDTIHWIDVCDAHGTWFDAAELPIFIRVFADRRTGDITEDDLRAAGLPGGGGSDPEGSFFTDLFRALSDLVR